MYTRQSSFVPQAGPMNVQAFAPFDFGMYCCASTFDEHRVDTVDVCERAYFHVKA
jgi:hypothetical protein